MSSFCSPYCKFHLFSVKLEGQEEAHVEILADVVERNIQLLNPDNKTQVQHIQFGPTYYGTDQLESFLLCNNGPDKINFVVLLDEDSEGQEVVSGMFERKMQSWDYVSKKIFTKYFGC